MKKTDNICKLKVFFKNKIWIFMKQIISILFTEQKSLLAHLYLIID